MQGKVHIISPNAGEKNIIVKKMGWGKNVFLLKIFTPAFWLAVNLPEIGQLHVISAQKQ